jgi:hypothetical protein
MNALSGFGQNSQSFDPVLIPVLALMPWGEAVFLSTIERVFRGVKDQLAVKRCELARAIPSRNDPVWSQGRGDTSASMVLRLSRLGHAV